MFNFGICIMVITLNNINIMGLLINGQVGWRAAGVIGAPAAASTLWTSVFGVWNADALSTVTTLNTNVFAAWNGESNTNDSLGNYNGTNNGVTFTTGKTGTSAFSFNGSSNYIALPQAALNFNKGNSGQSIGDFSVSFWVNLNTGSGDYQTVIGNWGDNGYGWQVVMFGGSFTFFGSDGSNGSTARIQHSLGLSKSNAINQWVHVVVTYTNQSQVKSYVNGVLTNTSSTTYQIRTNSRNNGNIGSFPQSGDNSSTKYWYLNGKLDAVTLWTKALTDAEASALHNDDTGYQYSFPSSTTTYVPSLNDAVGSNHGTRPASTLTGGVLGPTFTTGKIGKAFTFDGVNDYVQLPNNSFNSILSGDFSISMWVNTISLSSFQTLFSNFKSDGGGVYHGIILGINSNQFRFQIHNNTTEVLLQAGFSITTNTWNHIVVTRKYSTGTKIYVNGSLNTSNTNVTNPDVVALMYANIGAYMNVSGVPSGEYMSNNSKIDALSVWNKELSASEITELYNAGAGKQYPN